MALAPKRLLPYDRGEAWSKISASSLYLEDAVHRRYKNVIKKHIAEIEHQLDLIDADDAAATIEAGQVKQLA